MSQQRVPEEYRVQGSQLAERVRDLIHQGNIRQILIRREGRTILEIPLTLAAVGALIAPQFAAIGVLAALVTECTIVVERTGGEATAGDTWAELGPAATATMSAEEGTMGGIAGNEPGGMDVGGQDLAPDEPEAR